MKIGPLGLDKIFKNFPFLFRGTGKSAKFVRMSTLGPKLSKFARIVLSGFENPSQLPGALLQRDLNLHSTVVLRESVEFHRNQSDVVVHM